MRCPCGDVTGTSSLRQTGQADPNCAVCGGRSEFWAGPSSYSVPDEAGELTDVQTLIQARRGGAIIRGLLVSAEQADQHFDVIGDWRRGEMLISVRHENRIAYRDRLIAIDAQVEFNEILPMPSTSTMALEHYVVEMVHVMSVPDGATAPVRYEEGASFVVQNGALEWLPGQSPAATTRLSIRYSAHPAWIVTTYPHAVRASIVKLRRRGTVTPLGDPQPLPIRAAILLEHLDAERR